MPEIYDPASDTRYDGVTPHVSDQDMLNNALRAQVAGDPNAWRLLPPNWIQDLQSGKFREKTWWEEHGDTVMFIAQAAGSMLPGFFASGAGAGAGTGFGAAATGIGKTGTGVANVATGANNVATSLTSLAGLLPSTPIGNGMQPPIAGNIPSGAVPAATGAMNPVLNAFGTASPLLKTLTALGGLGLGKFMGDSGANNAVPPQLNDVLDLLSKRMQQQQPTFDAVTAGRYAMLPDFAKPKTTAG